MRRDVKGNLGLFHRFLKARGSFPGSRSFLIGCCWLTSGWRGGCASRSSDCGVRLGFLSCCVALAGRFPVAWRFRGRLQGTVLFTRSVGVVRRSTSRRRLRVHLSPVGNYFPSGSSPIEGVACSGSPAPDAALRRDLAWVRSLNDWETTLIRLSAPPML